MISYRKGKSVKIETISSKKRNLLNLSYLERKIKMLKNGTEFQIRIFCYVFIFFESFFQFTFHIKREQFWTYLLNFL